MNQLGFRDGVSKSLDQSVDGLPLQVHLKKLADIKAIATEGQGEWVMGVGEDIGNKLG